MAGENNLSGRAGLDSTDFKAGLAQMNRELRILDSGFKASAAEMGDWSSTTSGLELRIKALSGSIDIQKAKVAAVRAEYERVKTEKGETSRAAQDLEIKLNKENETLGKMNNELKNTEGALEEMKKGSDGAGDSVDDLGNKSVTSGGKLEAFKGILGGVGAIAKGVVVAMFALVAAIAAVGIAIAGLVFSSASAAAELVDLAAVTGINTTRLQELRFIGHQVGVELDTIAGANARLIRSQNAAREGTGAQAEAFNALGVSVLGADGQLRNSQEVFADVIDALGGIENETERDALAMQLFGKSAQDLNPLIAAGSDELARLAEEAHNAGAVMSEENVAALEAFDDQLASFKDGLMGTLGTLASAFLPGFTAIFDVIGGYAKEFAAIVSGSGGDLTKIGDGLTGLLTRIVTDIAAQAPQLVEVGLTIILALVNAIVGAFPQLLAAGIQIIQTLLKAITSTIPTLIRAGIPILVGLINAILQSLPLLLQAAVQIILTLVTSLIDNLPMLITAAIEAVLALAQGLAEALPVLIPAVVQAVITIVETLIENIPMLIEAALALILGLAEGLIAALPILIAAMPRIMRAIFQALVQSLPLIGDAAVQLVITLLKGIVSALPSLHESGMQISRVLVKGVTDLASSLVQTGKDIVLGIWNGIASQADWFHDQISNFFAGIVEDVQEALGIESPSKVFAGIGANTIKGFSLGALQEFKTMERQLALAFNGLTLSPALSGIGSNVSSRQESFAFYAPVYFQGPSNPESLGEAIKGKRF